MSACRDLAGVVRELAVWRTENRPNTLKVLARLLLLANT